MREPSTRTSAGPRFGGSISSSLASGYFTILHSRTQMTEHTYAIVPGQGLTTTKAPYIEQAVADGQMYIEQPYELYSAENHETWRRLYSRMQERWVKYAN